MESGAVRWVETRHALSPQMHRPISVRGQVISKEGNASPSRWQIMPVSCVYPCRDCHCDGRKGAKVSGRAARLASLMVSCLGIMVSGGMKNKSGFLDGLVVSISVSWTRSLHLIIQARQDILEGVGLLEGAGSASARCLAPGTRCFCRGIHGSQCFLHGLIFLDLFVEDEELCVDILAHTPF